MASRGVNKVIVVGNLGNDPEVKYMPNGGAVTNISVATSEVWKDKQTGQPQERTEWHRIVFFNRIAEIAGEYLRKGSKVYIEGSLRTRKWQAQDGSDRYSTEIVADQMQMLDSRGDNGGQQQGNYGGQQGGYAQQPQQQAPMQQPQQAAPMQQAPAQQAAPAPMQQQAPAQQSAPAQQAPAQQPASAPAGGFDGFDDDIPF